MTPLRQPKHSLLPFASLHIVICCSCAGQFIGCDKTAMAPVENKIKQAGEQNPLVGLEIKRMSAELDALKSIETPRFDVPPSHYRSIIAALSPALEGESKNKGLVLGGLWILDSEDREIWISLLATGNELTFSINGVVYHGGNGANMINEIRSAYFASKEGDQ